MSRGKRTSAGSPQRIIGRLPTKILSGVEKAKWLRERGEKLGIDIYRNKIHSERCADIAHVMARICTKYAHEFEVMDDTVEVLINMMRGELAILDLQLFSCMQTYDKLRGI